MEPIKKRVRAALALLVVLACACSAAVFLRRDSGGDDIRAVADGRDHLKYGRPASALRAVSMLGEESPAFTEALTVRGLALAALNRIDECRRTLERASELDPEQPLALKTLAAVYFSRNETARGLDLLKQAAILDPEDFRPWFAAGDVYRRQENAERAKEAFRQALRRRADHHESRVGFIWALLAAGQFEEADPLLQAALRDRSDDPHLLALAARHARDLGRPDDALDFADRSLSIDPDNVEALVARASLLLRSGHAHRALPDAERAARFAPENPAALYILARTETALKLTQRAAATAARHRALLTKIASNDS